MTDKIFHAPCHEGHPTFRITPETAEVRGGSARSPAKGFDVYVDLDSQGTPDETQQAPWRVKDGIVRVRYYIANYNTPKDPQSFRAFVDWLCTQVQGGKRVHVGCIGGHGRTGLVFAAMRRVLAKDRHAIAWTRANHCHKAVETPEQVGFLVKHFDCAAIGARYGKHHGGDLFAYTNGSKK